MENETFKWLGYGFVTIFTLLGGAKLLEMLFARYFQKADSRKLEADAASSKQIESDGAKFTKTLDSYAERISKLETRLDKMQEELNSQMVQNAILEVENKHLRDKEREQGAEISRLRDSDRRKTEKISQLEHNLRQAQTQIEILGRKIDELSHK